MALLDEPNGTHVFDLIFHNIRDDDTAKSRGLTEGRS